MKAKIFDLKRIAGFLYEVGTMRKIIRAHRQTLLSDDFSDTISSHSYRVTMIGYFLAHLEKVDPYKVIVMCMFHDLGETRGGDQNWVNKKYVKVYDDEIHESQIKELLPGSELENLCGEYSERETLESKIAKDADLLDQVLLLREYEHQGNKEAARWLEDNAQIKLMYSESAKKLAKEVCSQEPNFWWWNLWTSKRR
jgi:putative hydrolases of HD superfamily